VLADADAASADDTTRTIVMRSPDADTVHWDEPHAAWMSLERVLPADEAGLTRIEKEVATVGRAIDSDVRLFSASASRQHARIEQKNGAWVLVPIEGRRVIVDGETLDGEVELQAGMRLVFGDDELVVADQEEPDESEAEARFGIRPELVVLATAATGAALYACLRMLGYL
jgi:predicted component of type VI protein secretion system